MTDHYRMLIDTLVRSGYLKSPRIIEAFQKVRREDFVLPHARDESSGNYPLHIGYGQTISQPATVAFMLELLEPKPGGKILDVGAGSGWTTALLAHITGERGKVIGIEIIKDLQEFGKNNLSQYDFPHAKIVLGDGSKGFEKQAPFDRIIVSAAARKDIPQPLLDQLKIGGRMVIPVGTYWQSIVKVDKLSENKFEKEVHPGFAFVPLREEP